MALQAIQDQDAKGNPAPADIVPRRAFMARVAAFGAGALAAGCGITQQAENSRQR